MLGSREAAIRLEKKHEGTYGGFTVGKFSEREFARHEKFSLGNDTELYKHLLRLNFGILLLCPSIICNLYLILTIPAIDSVINNIIIENHISFSEKHALL